jgi:hypothetical protein
VAAKHMVPRGEQPAARPQGGETLPAPRVTRSFKSEDWGEGGLCGVV